MDVTKNTVFYICNKTLQDNRKYKNIWIQKWEIGKIFFNKNSNKKLKPV